MIEASITSLLELGANRTQALAALKAAKGDVMAATDRYFSGEYDHLEDAANDGKKAPEAVCTKEVDVGIVNGPSDYEEEPDWNEDFADDQDYELGMQDAFEEQHISRDPYANIFTSKDRVEEVVEVEEEAITGTMVVKGYDSKKELPYSILLKGDWLSGCPEKGEQSILFQLYHQLSEGEMNCTSKGCSGTIVREQVDFFARFESFSNYLLHTRDRIQRACPICSATYCLACEELVRPSRNKSAPATTEDQKNTGECEKLVHCPNIQGVLIGVGLHYAQDIHLEPLTAASNPSQNVLSPRKRKRSVEESSDEDTQASGKKATTSASLSNKTTPQKKASGGPVYIKSSVGTGAGTGYSGDKKENRSGEEKAGRAQQEKDQKLEQILREVRVYLPDPFRKGGSRPSDSMMHSSVFSHLRRRFNQIACSLLQSDSITDIYHRESVFTELMEWLQFLSLHDGLASALAMTHMRAVSIRLEKKAGREEKIIRYEGMASPRELLERIVIQCSQTLKSLSMAQYSDEETESPKKENLKVLVNKSKQKASGVEDIETAALESFCHMIIKRADSVDEALKTTKGEAFVERMRQELPALGRAAGSEAGGYKAYLSRDDDKKAYLDFVNRTRFDYCAMSKTCLGVTQWNSCFTADILGLTNGMVTSKRTLAIAKEIGTMSQNLPAAWDSSVFIRVDENRIDVIKAMIIGPEGSPYWNGCYIFDLFLPGSYNQASIWANSTQRAAVFLKCDHFQVAPKCHIVSTFGGRHRFGPNLYANGKVCLSLLGTWHGPGWIAGKSTVLQVLISIQALILGTPSPIVCEPGYEGLVGGSADAGYNANIRRMVVNTAMIDQITKPCAPFEDVIHEHFRRKAQEIREQLVEWELLDDGGALKSDSMSAAHGNSAARASVEFKKNFERMKSLLNDLEAGEDVTAA